MFPLGLVNLHTSIYLNDTIKEDLKSLKYIKNTVNDSIINEPRKTLF